MTIFWIVLGVGLAAALIALCWPTRGQRAYGYPQGSVEARMLRGEE